MQACKFQLFVSSSWTMELVFRQVWRLSRVHCLEFWSELKITFLRNYLDAVHKCTYLHIQPLYCFNRRIESVKFI